MLLPLLDGVIAKTVSESALRRILIVPFAIQIVGTVGLVGYLSFRNGQQAIDDLVSQLMIQVSDRVDQHLDAHLAIPHQINQVNLDAFELGLLDFQDFQSTGHYFWKQMKVFDVGYINFANETGEFIGVERLDNDTLVINETVGKADNLLQVYTTDNEGNRVDSDMTDDDADVREEEWYADAVQAGKPIWSQIYQWQDKPEILSLSSSYPIYRAHLRSFGFYEKMLGSVYSKCHGLFKQSDRFRMGNHRASVVGGVASEEEDSSPGLELSRPDGRHLLSPQEWMQLGGLAQRFAPLLNGLLALQTVAGRRDA